MWIKGLICIAVVAFCMLVGYLAAAKFRARKKYFAQLFLFNERYLTELGYARKPLSTFLGAYEYTGDFQETVRALSERRELPQKRFLTAEEGGEVADYFRMLGRGDSRSQLAFFNTKKEWIDGRRRESEAEAGRRTALYLKLGLLAGLALVILIV